MKDYNVCLRFDVETKEQADAVRAIVSSLAEVAITQARLIAGKRKPQIKVWSDDFIYGEEDIALFAPK